MNEPWRIQLFGTLRARQGGRTITRFRTQKTGALLAYLAYHRQRSHPREVLIELFWPDSETESGRHSLSLALSSLRHQLEPPGVPDGSVIVADRFSVELNPDAFTTDVAEFELALRLAAQARNAPNQAELLADAVARYGGPLLPGYYEDWIVPEQERLSQRFHQATGQLIGLLEKEGKLERALEFAQRAVSLDPLGEEAHRDLMRLLAVAGHPDAALRQYRELERILDQELGEAPGSATRQLARQIQTQMAATLPSEGVEVPVPSPAARPAPPSLPAGTVTFLLTDIEGSTALWEQTGEAFRQALAIHHTLLRREFRRNGGHEIKEAGDSFLVAFTSASDALACAVACQRALAGLEVVGATGRSPIRVRMALHTGDVALETGEYHGLVLHRASRMLSAAHGGQILCSEATAALLRRDLEPEVRLKDLGVYRLRDVEEPERLFQVAYPDMPHGEFPPLRADVVHVAHLPLQFTRFFGREQELSQLEEMLRPDPQRDKRGMPVPRLVTLTGAGGTGKTRLAIEAAGRVAESFSGAVWFVPLADLNDPLLIAGSIVEALGLPRSASIEPLHQAMEFLSRQPSLLILDNIEHLVAEGAGTVQKLLEQVPTLTVVATSRQLLGLPGEREFVVLPLPTPSGPESPERLGLYESVRLFVDRSQAVKPDFQVTNGNAPAVAELCIRLEGIPLAIELAAARALVMTPVQMLSQLSKRFEFLVSRRRGVVERQRTLRAAVDWSYRLLAPDLQRFFASLSVFRGGWTVEAAEGVCDEPLALDFLAQLRECSLVLTEECPHCRTMRFRLLETLREYAAERLTTEELEAVRGRHAEYFLALSEEAEAHLTGPEQAEWLHRLDAEHDNLRAALEWCQAGENGWETGLRLTGALWRFWSVRGHARDARRVVESLLALVPSDHAALGHSAARAKALDCAGSLAHDVGDHAAAYLWLEESLALWRASGDISRIANTLNLLANVALDRGEIERAGLLYEEALVHYLEIGNARGTAMVFTNLGALALDRGDEARAAELLEESLRLKRSLGNPYSLAFTLELLGNIEKNRGDYARSASFHTEALSLRRELGHKQGIAMSLNNLGHALLSQGQPEAAARHLLESLALFQELMDIRGLAECLMNLAGVAGTQGHHEVCPRLAGAATALREAHGVQLTASERVSEERLLGMSREAMGEEAFRKAEGQGKRMGVEEAMEFVGGVGGREDPLAEARG